MAKGKGSEMAVTREDYLWRIISERLSGKVQEGFTSGPMKDGVENEPLARSAYEAKTGAIIREVGFMPHPSIPGFGASPDGLIGIDGGFEVKCPKIKKHGKALLSPSSAADIDREYMLQMHAQGACCGLKWVDFVTYTPWLPDSIALRVDRVILNKDLIGEIQSAVADFLGEVDAIIEKLIEKTPALLADYEKNWLHKGV
jgi:hypothetical protein